MRRKYGMDKILRLRKTLAGGMTNQCGSRSQCQNESAENPKKTKSPKQEPKFENGKFYYVYLYNNYS